MSVAATRESFSVTGSDTSGGLRLEVTASGRTGDIEIDIDISSVRPLDDILPESLRVASVPGRVSISPSGLVRMRNSVRSLRGGLVRRFGFSRSTISSLVSVSSPSRRDLGFSRDLGSFDTLPFSFSESVSFQPAVVPEVNGTLERLPGVPITVTIVPTGILTRFTTDFPSVEIELPPEAFVSTVSIESFDCAVLFSNIQSSLDELEQRSLNIEEIRRDIDELQDIRSEILSASGTGSLPNLTAESLSGITGDRVSNWESRAREADTTPVPGVATITSLQSRASRVEDRIDNIGVPNCRSEFSSRIDSIQSELEELERLSTRADNLREQILSNLPSLISLSSIPCVDRDFGEVSGDSIDSQLNGLENRVSDLSNLSSRDFTSGIEGNIRSTISSIESDIRLIPSDNECRSQFMSRLNNIRSSFRSQLDRLSQRVELGCDDVAQFVINSVASVETQARIFRDSSEASRTSRRFNSILEDIESSRSLVTGRVRDDNPCKSQLLSRLDTTESILRSVSISRPRDRIRSRSCDSLFPSIDDRLTSFEDDVIAIDPPVEPETFELMVTRADNLISQIEREIPEEQSRCIRQFSRRVDGAINRLGRVGARVSITTREELTSDEIDRRQEVVNELQSRLEEIAERREFF